MVGDDVDELGPRGRVLAERRLVEQEDPRVQGERRAHAEPSLLAARERERVGGRQVGQVQAIEHPSRPLRRLGLRDAGAHQPVVHLVDCPTGHELVLRVLEHHPEGARDLGRGPSPRVDARAAAGLRGDPHSARRGLQQPCEAGKQGGLPRAGGTGHRDHLPGADREVRGRQPVGHRHPLSHHQAPARLGDRGPAGEMGVVEPDPRRGVGPAREVRHQVGRRKAQHRTSLDEQHMVGARQPGLDPVLDDHDRAAVSGPHHLDRGEDRGGRGRVEVRRGLVEQEQVRIGDGGRGHGEQLLLSAAEPRGVPGQGHVQPHCVQRGRNVGPDLRRRHGSVLQGERDVVADPLHHDVALRLLLDQPDPRRRRVAPGAGDKQPPGVPTLGQRPGKGGQHRRLARPRGAHQDHQLARLDRERHVGQRDRRSARVLVSPPECGDPRPRCAAHGRRPTRRRHAPGRAGRSRGRRCAPAGGPGPTSRARR